MQSAVHLPTAPTEPDRRKNAPAMYLSHTNMLQQYLGLFVTSVAPLLSSSVTHLSSWSLRCKFRPEFALFSFCSSLTLFRMRRGQSNPVSEHKHSQSNGNHLMRDENEQERHCLARGHQRLLHRCLEIEDQKYARVKGSAQSEAPEEDSVWNHGQECHRHPDGHAVTCATIGKLLG